MDEKVVAEEWENFNLFSLSGFLVNNISIIKIHFISKLPQSLIERAKMIWIWTNPLGCRDQAHFMIILIVGVSNESTGVPWWLSGLKKKKRHLKCSSHRRLGFDHWVEKIPWRRTWQPIPIFLPGKSHGQRRLEGYSPLGCKESDRAEGT